VGEKTGGGKVKCWFGRPGLDYPNIKITVEKTRGNWGQVMGANGKILEYRGEHGGAGTGIGENGWTFDTNIACWRERPSMVAEVRFLGVSKRLQRVSGGGQKPPVRTKNVERLKTVSEQKRSKKTLLFGNLPGASPAFMGTLFDGERRRANSLGRGSTMGLAGGECKNRQSSRHNGGPFPKGTN